MEARQRASMELLLPAGPPVNCSTPAKSISSFTCASDDAKTPQISDRAFACLAVCRPSISFCRHREPHPRTLHPTQEARNRHTLQTMKDMKHYEQSDAMTRTRPPTRSSQTTRLLSSWIILVSNVEAEVEVRWDISSR